MCITQQVLTGLDLISVLCCSRLYQMCKLLLFGASSGLYSCPLAMTDGAAKTIESLGKPAELREAYSPVHSHPICRRFADLHLCVTYHLRHEPNRRFHRPSWYWFNFTDESWVFCRVKDRSSASDLFVWRGALSPSSRQTWES